MPGYVEVRYDDKQKRVVYEPVSSPRNSARSISCRPGRARSTMFCLATRRPRATRNDERLKTDLT